MTAMEEHDAYDAIARALDPAREALSQLAATQRDRPQNPRCRDVVAFAELVRECLSAAAIEARTQAGRTLEGCHADAA